MGLLAGWAQAQEVPDRAGLGQRQFRLAELSIDTTYRLPADLHASKASPAMADLAVLGLQAGAGRMDVRSGRWAALLLAEPLLPGKGAGNRLKWAELGRPAPRSDSELSKAAVKSLREFLQAAAGELRIDMAELAHAGKATVHRDGTVIQVYIPRTFEGIPVRGNYLTATINNGNLVLLGTVLWGEVNASTVPLVSASGAVGAVQSHVGAFQISGDWARPELILVPVARGSDPDLVTPGHGLDYRLAWAVRPTFVADRRHFEGLVDAHTGQLLSFLDTNQYVATQREARGGVYPVTNDGLVPDGVEQAGWPMPFDNVTTPTGTVTTDSGGNLPAPVDGDITSNLSGEYVHINDTCGAIGLTSSNDVDFGTSVGTDCDTPGFGGAGNTHASRTGFHELNRIIEMGRSHLPGNTWLQQTLTANMNLNQTCNAFWGGGTVNFYRSGGGCSNTGEIAGVFDHEWGHGLDDNDAIPFIASPSGEGIADIYMALRLNTSCIGRNFRATQCTGFGDACLDCTGVRDIDYLKHASGLPHDYTWSNATCGSSVHCIGHVYSEAVWSLWKRELQGPPYNYDNNTAQEIVTRLTYIGAGNTGTWFSGGPPNGGCAANSGYMNYLAADDDNGNLADGTPHMTAIYNAFNDQEIACGTPAVQDAGCAGTPTTAPVLTAAPLDKSVSLSWTAVAGTSEYQVFRTDGVFGCDFGKVLVASTAGNSLNDDGLQNGRDYAYLVIPKGGADACFGPASACATTAPAAGPNADLDPGSTVLAIFTGDGDAYIDNCEEATLSFDVNNTGLGTLTNVRITGVTVVSPAGSTVTTVFPAPVSPSTLSQGDTGIGSFDFTAGGLAFGDALVFEVSFTADEISPVVKTETLTVENAETDLQFVASKTWDFETDLDGWTVIEGTFNQATTGGGANGSAGYLASSAFLDNQCDQVRSPGFRLTSGSTLSLWNNYDIEYFSYGQWWDRANVAIFEDGARNAVAPDGGRLYNASGPGATCATAGQGGWADANSSWGSSSWSATALDSATRAGESVQLDIAYGTDPAVNGEGFRFDQVTVTDIEMLVPDAQNDDCGVPVNHIPVVAITAPPDGSVFDVGEVVNFAGTATDSEDGDIGANLEWTSSIDGFIGTGAGFGTSGLGVGTHTITAEATDSGDPTASPQTGSDQITVTIGINDPPTVTITAPADGSSFNLGDNVNLTGTASDPEDGDISASIAWSSNLNGGLGSGASINTSGLSAGSHTITADVTDSGAPTGVPENGSDTISVTILVNLAPSVTITAPADGSSFDDGESVNFTATASDPEDGDISPDLSWTSSIDGVIGSGAAFATAGLSTGSHSITAEVTDSGNPTGSPESGSDTISVTINPPPADVHVESILTGTANAPKGQKYGTATVTIHDEFGNPAAGYTVTGQFSGSYGESRSAITDASGVAVVQTLGTAKKGIVVEFCVSDVAGPLPYDPGDDADPGYACPAAPDPTDVHVENIEVGNLNEGGGSKRGTAKVTVYADDGMAQPGYTVSGTFSGNLDESPAPLVTGADGTVTFQTSGTFKGKLNLSFCVNGVSGALPYDPGDNADPAYACP